MIKLDSIRFVPTHPYSKKVGMTDLLQTLHPKQRHGRRHNHSHSHSHSWYTYTWFYSLFFLFNLNELVMLFYYTAGAHDSPPSTVQPVFALVRRRIFFYHSIDGPFIPIKYWFSFHVIKDTPLVSAEFPQETVQLSAACLDFEAEQRRRCYTRFLLSYDQFWERLRTKFWGIC